MIFNATGEILDRRNSRPEKFYPRINTGVSHMSFTKIQQW
jgi:hypothetical protein